MKIYFIQFGQVKLGKQNQKALLKTIYKFFIVSPFL